MKTFLRTLIEHPERIPCDYLKWHTPPKYFNKNKHISYTCKCGMTVNNRKLFK